MFTGFDGGGEDFIGEREGKRVHGVPSPNRTGISIFTQKLIPRSLPLNPRAMSEPISVKRIRKPKLVSSAAKAQKEEPKEVPEEPKEVPEEPKEAVLPKKIRRPKMVSDTSSVSSTSSVKRKPKTKIEKNSVSMVSKEVVLPTHQEREQEELDTEGFDVEVVRVSVFELNGVTYFRDSKKDKLYKRIKEKSVGDYVGRYDARTGTIFEVPDSDCES